MKTNQIFASFELALKLFSSRTRKKQQLKKTCFKLASEPEPRYWVTHTRFEKVWFSQTSLPGWLDVNRCNLIHYWGGLEAVRQTFLQHNININAPRNDETDTQLPHQTFQNPVQWVNVLFWSFLSLVTLCTVVFFAFFLWLGKNGDTSARPCSLLVGVTFDETCRDTTVDQTLPPLAPLRRRFVALELSVLKQFHTRPLHHPPVWKRFLHLAGRNPDPTAVVPVFLWEFGHNYRLYRYESYTWFLFNFKV